MEMASQPARNARKIPSAVWNPRPFTNLLVVRCRTALGPKPINLLSRGKSHNTAVRALAFKWIRIIFRLWQDHTLYDEERHLRNLTKRHSPLRLKI